MLKKIIQINTVCNTSTGNIMGAIQREANESGYETLSIVGRRKTFRDVACIKIGNGVSFWLHVFLNTVLDRQGYGSYFVTKKIVKRLRAEKPDIIHLHNLHGYYINLPVLFEYLSKDFKGKVFWTFHDCWPFTGHCAHFSAIGCGKWKKGCYKCPNKMVYPVSLFLDASKKNYEDKKKMFCGLENLTIITPSEWMAEQINQSFFRQYPVKVINNGIDLKTFFYRKNGDVLFDKYNIAKGKKIISGVASIWSKYKGMGDFLSLAKILPADYQIVLAGLSRRQRKNLPANITGILRMDNRDELAMLYSVSDIFINPSLEESFSLVTVEAIACGTPVIVLDTSAVKELVCDDNGIVLAEHKAEDYLKAIMELERKKLPKEVVMGTARKYDAEVFVERVVRLYEQT